MRKFYLKFIAFLLISLVLIQSPAYATADTRFYSTDVKQTACYTSTTVGGMTCYQQTVDAAVTLGTGASATQVQGTAADGAAAVGSPVQIGGKDGSGNVQSILTGTDGTVKVDGSAVTQPVSGTVTCAQATAANLNATVTDGAGALNTIVDSGTITCNAGTNLNTSALSTEATLSSLNGKVTACNTGAVTVSSSALPTGASTLAEQQTQTTSLSVLDDWDNAASDGASISGDVAHDSADAGEPVKLGAKAVPTDGTDPGETVAEDDRVNLRGTLDGLLLTSEQHPFSWSATEAETAATTNDEIKAAPGANLSLYVCTLIISNGATAGDYKLVEDTAGTPVTLVEKIYTGVTGGAVMKFSPCIRATANKNIGITSTTVTTGSYTVSGYTAP